MSHTYSILPNCTTPGSGTIAKEGPLDAINNHSPTPAVGIGKRGKVLSKEVIGGIDFTKLSLTFTSNPALQDFFFSTRAMMRALIELNMPACSNFLTVTSNSVFLARDLFIWSV